MARATLERGCSNCAEVAYGTNWSTETAARPSHGAIEDKIGTSQADGPRREQQKMDQVGMKAAKRAENRIKSNDENIPSSTIFSK